MEERPCVRFISAVLMRLVSVEFRCLFSFPKPSQFVNQNRLPKYIVSQPCNSTVFHHFKFHIPPRKSANYWNNVTLRLVRLIANCNLASIISGAILRVLNVWFVILLPLSLPYCQCNYYEYPKVNHSDARTKQLVYKIRHNHKFLIFNPPPSSMNQVNK